MKSHIGMRSCALLNSILSWTCLSMFCKSWINWISNFIILWLISQLLVQSSISLFQFYHVIFYPVMDLCLVIHARIWENSWGNMHKISNCFENNTWDCITYALAIDGPHELQNYILLGASYVQRVVRAWNDRFPNLQIFNVAKIFNPRKYPSNDSDWITNT